MARDIRKELIETHGGETSGRDRIANAEKNAKSHIAGTSRIGSMEIYRLVDTSNAMLHAHVHYVHMHQVGTVDR